MRGRWAIASAAAGSESLDTLLLEGWEPFGVVVEDGTMRQINPGETLHSFAASGGGGKTSVIWLRRMREEGEDCDPLRALAPCH